MANKYIRHGETYCGDGTTSAAAASAGAAGAWNNINVLEGTAPAYGALAAGDTVYIRSKDNAGADITRTLAAHVSLGSTAGTAASPICWIVDGGTVWSGIDGTLKYATAGSYSITFLANNRTGAEVQDKLVCELTNNWPGAHLAVIRGYVKNTLFDMTVISQSSFGINIDTIGATLESPHIKIGSALQPRILVSYISPAILINPDIELLSSAAEQFAILVGSYWDSTVLEIYGGKIHGAGASTGNFLFQLDGEGTAGAARIRTFGLSVPISMSIAKSTLTTSKAGKIEMLALDGVLGAHTEEGWGWATSRTDNNPPVLSAQLPDSALTLWAWRLYPRAAAFNKPAKLPAAKVYTGTAAAKTISLEFLVATTFPAATKKNVWMTVEYIDSATGLPKHISTFDPSGAALDTSTAAWSTTSWGLVSCAKKKLSLNTPTSIKQDTTVLVTFWCAVASASGTDVMFIDSDFGMNDV